MLREENRRTTETPSGADRQGIQTISKLILASAVQSVYTVCALYSRVAVEVTLLSSCSTVYLYNLPVRTSSTSTSTSTCKVLPTIVHASGINLQSSFNSGSGTLIPSSQLLLSRSTYNRLNPFSQSINQSINERGFISISCQTHTLFVLIKLHRWPRTGKLPYTHSPTDEITIPEAKNM